ncbi:MAG: hypothetical protein RLP02_15425 [Coleofasciculus sp. C2-GNP5-27]
MKEIILANTLTRSRFSSAKIAPQRFHTRFISLEHMRIRAVLP